MKFYKHKIAEWMDGTGTLSDGAYRVYHVVCQLIYQHEGPIAHNERGIAGNCNQRLEDFRRYLKQLTDAGKVTILRGKIYNERCADELDRVTGNRANGAKGGEATASRRQGAASGSPEGRQGVARPSLGGRRGVASASLDDNPLENQGAVPKPLQANALVSSGLISSTLTPGSQIESSISESFEEGQDPVVVPLRRGGK